MKKRADPAASANARELPFGLGGVVVIVLGLLGKKDYLDRELQKMSEDGPTRIADAILNALL